jgi:hypothetical protein
MEDPYDQTITGYLFCVFAAPTPESFLGDREGVDLRHTPDARFLEKLLEPLYMSDGIGLGSSDDEVIPPDKLDALEAVVRSAVVRVEQQPERWPVHIGNEYIPFQEQFGDPIYRVAERERLLTFLGGVLSEIDLARRHGYYLIWGGGT